LYLYSDIGAVGIDVWQVKSGTIFDNFIVTDNFEEAKKFAEDTWGVSKDGEKKMKDEIDAEEKKKQDELDKQKEDDEEDNEDEEEEEDEGLDLGKDEL